MYSFWGWNYKQKTKLGFITVLTSNGLERPRTRKDRTSPNQKNPRLHFANSCYRVHEIAFLSRGVWFSSHAKIKVWWHIRYLETLQFNTPNKAIFIVFQLLFKWSSQSSVYDFIYKIKINIKLMIYTNKIIIITFMDVRETKQTARLTILEICRYKYPASNINKLHLKPCLKRGHIKRTIGDVHHSQISPSYDILIHVIPIHWRHNKTWLRIRMRSFKEKLWQQNTIVKLESTKQQLIYLTKYILQYDKPSM